MFWLLIYCQCTCYEGFPMVVLEAWPWGIVVVRTPMDSLLNAIGESKNLFEKI